MGLLTFLKSLSERPETSGAEHETGPVDLVLKLPGKAHARLHHLMEMTKVSDHVETIKQALILYDIMVSITFEEGGTFGYRAPDGTWEEFCLYDLKD